MRYVSRREFGTIINTPPISLGSVTTEKGWYPEDSNVLWYRHTHYKFLGHLMAVSMECGNCYRETYEIEYLVEDF